MSRTQYQYSLEHPRCCAARDLGAAGSSTRSARARSSSDVATDQQTGGLQRDLVDRSRHRVAVRHHRADGRRHAVQRVRPAPGVDDLHAAEPVPRRPRGRAEVSPRPDALARLYVPSADGRPGAAAGDHAGRDDQRAADDQPPGRSFRSATLSFNLAPGASLGEAVEAVDRRRDRSGCRQLRAGFQGTAQAFQASLANERC